MVRSMQIVARHLGEDSLCDVTNNQVDRNYRRRNIAEKGLYEVLGDLLRTSGIGADLTRLHLRRNRNTYVYIYIDI